MSLFLSQFPYSVEKQLTKVEELNKLIAVSNCPIQIYLFRILNCSWIPEPLGDRDLYHPLTKVEPRFQNTHVQCYTANNIFFKVFKEALKFLLYIDIEFVLIFETKLLAKIFWGREKLQKTSPQEKPITHCQLANLLSEHNIAFTSVMIVGGIPGLFSDGSFH